MWVLILIGGGFDVRYMDNGNVNSYNLFYVFSNGNTDARSYGYPVFPAVTLNSNIQLECTSTTYPATATATGETHNIWSIK